MDVGSSTENLRSITTVCGVGAQLIIFSDDESVAFGQVVAKCKAAGYDYVEATLSILDVPPEEVLKAQEGNDGIPLQTVHVGYREIGTDDALSRTIGLLRAVGAPFLMCSGRSPDSPDPEYGVTESSNRFNAAAQQCADCGITFYYHCFDWCFQPLAGVDFIGELLHRTEGEPVKFCLDLMWTKYGQTDPAEAIRMLGHRCDYYHFKDGIGLNPPTQPQFVPLGKGEVELDSCLDAIRILDSPVYIVVEQDRELTSPFQDLVDSREFLRRRGI